ncbi:adrenocorticotropic hormone receptor-like [Orbicella faveolata]|uniref:adrenocorticotropic hormone receptor-like n=1 Tax=Orbicella faveolata TaxID=48498 RepID=UPI0009E4264A|nr:adrenocorticotropic hormone receptor-like [Orbicella faveolata]
MNTTKVFGKLCASVVSNATRDLICGPEFVLGADLCLSSAVIMFTVASVTIVGNLLLLLTIRRNHRRLFRTPSTFLIANLGVSDLLIGLLVGYFVVVRDTHRYMQQEVPDFIRVVIEVFEALTLFITGCTIIALSADRYIAVSDPMGYRSTVTKKRVKIFIMMVWISSVLLCSLPLTGLDKKIYSIVYLHTHATVPILLLTAICIKIFRALKLHRREMETLQDSPMNRRREMARERKMSHTVYIILTLFYLTLIPAYITIHIGCWYKGSDLYLRSVFRLADFFSTRFLFLNSAIDPYVYAWRIPKYRQGFMKIISFRRQRPKTEITCRSHEQTLKQSATTTLTCKNSLQCGKIVVECHSNYGEPQTTHF